MAKDPAFLFYPGDWLGGTSTFSRFLKGCYMDILVAQFNSGHLSLEEIKTVLGSDFGQAWPTLQKKFKKDGIGLFFNERLELEIIKRKEYSESRRKNRIKKTYDKTYDEHMIKHMSLHMENENENRNKDEVRVKEGVETIRVNVARETKSKHEVTELLFSDELFIEQLKMTHRGKDIKQAWDECYIHHNNAPNPPNTLQEWKQKLNTWLTNTKPGKTNGTSKNKHQQHTSNLAASYAQTYGNVLGGGADG